MVLLPERLSLSHRQRRASTMTELLALVRAAEDGDKEAFGQVVRRFQDMAYASAYATVGDAGLAQDIAQEAFLDAYLLPEEAFYCVGTIGQAVAKATQK